jgi:serine/threonine-protein kinase HipA
MAQDAGINIGNGCVKKNINGRDALLLERFDLDGRNQYRKHVVTVNAFLKDPTTFIDFGQSFRYDNIHELLKTHSVNIADDLEQLLLQMLFNRAINNTDDHERNFSLLNNGEGYCLAPAYDLVPTLTRAQYHAAGFQYSTNPISPSEVNGINRIFGVPKKQTKCCADRVLDSVSRWKYFAEKAQVNERDAENIESVLNL